MSVTALYNEEYLDKYVRLTVRTGLNVRPGQKVVISSPVDCAFFARRAAREAYAAGASNVFVRWVDDECSRLKYLMAADDAFDEFPAWESLMLNSLAREGAAFMSVSASDPELLRGVDPSSPSRFRKVSSAALREYYDLAMDNSVQWSVVSIPTAAWAKKVFPEAADGDEAVRLLWNKIFDACRIDSGDPVENWAAHCRALKSRVGRLNLAQYTELHITNAAGTDLRLKMPQNHVWSGGGDISRGGNPFLPNIPTEEVFTTPRLDGADGRVVSSRPTVYDGDIIDGFSITFENGRAVSCSAEKNQALLEKLIHDLPGMDRLGEVALVPHSSPISNTGILFYNTLYDENASCHLALGRAYPDCVKGGEDMTREQQAAAGLNYSDGHHDFMFGTDDLSVVGITPDGGREVVFEKGNFAAVWE